MSKSKPPRSAEEGDLAGDKEMYRVQDRKQEAVKHSCGLQRARPLRIPENVEMQGASRLPFFCGLDFASKFLKDKSLCGAANFFEVRQPWI